MTMQPELPWNVAGIAPEAREAARASARREGLSVGEWLTRRILRGMADAEATAEEWWFAEADRSKAVGESGHSRRDNHGRVRILNDNIDFRNGQSRTETAQTAAGARERADNLDRLTARLAQLDARLAKVEHASAVESTKQAETITSLQRRIAGLSEQISTAASRGAAHSTELAKTVQALAGKYSQARAQADQQHSAMEERVSAVTADLGALSERLEQTRTEDDSQFQLVRERIASVEIGLETVGRDREAVERLDGSLDTLARRVEATETEYLNNIEHLESRLTRVEANSGDTVIDRRLQGIEQALADMARLIEKTQPEKSTAAAAAESQPADAQPVVTEARDTSPHVAPFGSDAAPPILDLPPFPQKHESTFTAPPAGLTADPTPDLRASPGNKGATERPAKLPLAAEVESYLAAARRNALAGGSPPTERNGAFSWIDPIGQEHAKDGPQTRLMLLGGIGLIALAAIGMGLYLSSNLSRPAPIASATANLAHNTTIAAKPKAQSVLPQPSAAQAIATPASGARRAPVVPRNATSAVTGSVPQSHAAASPNRPIAPAPKTQKSSTAAQTMPLVPLQRLAALAGTGNAKAQEVLGLAYLDGDGVAVNEAEGAKWLERAAARGEALAAYRLGTLYERGHGVASSQAKAMRWYTVAAKAGNRKAMHNLAVAYAQGGGVKKDYSLAAQWFLRAANLGLADSQFNLAVLYERGMGVQQSLVQAYKWYAIAAAQGDAESRTRMEALASQISVGDKATAEKQVAAFRPTPLDRAANAPPIVASIIGG